MMVGFLTILIPLAVYAALLFYFPIYLIRRHDHKQMVARAGEEAREFAPNKYTTALYAFVIASLVVLLFIAVPNLLTFRRIPEHSEARKNLSIIYVSRLAYHGEYGVYPEGPDAFDAMRFEPVKPCRYSFYMDDDVFGNEEGEPIDIRPGRGWPFTIGPETSVGSFTAMAVGNIDDDPFLDVWSIDDSKQMKHLADDENNKMEQGLCWPDMCRWEGGAAGALMSGLDKVMEVSPIILLGLCTLSTVILLVHLFNDAEKRRKLKRRIGERGVHTTVNGKDGE